MSSVKVYKASAGSGKTFTLAVQYIRLLITTNPMEYRHTLAVTFTNKATAEMKDRILEQLYGISQGLESSENYLEALQKELKENGIEISDKEIRKRCQDALHYILHDYSRFRIETIDSFFQSVLRNLAHELGLNARLQVDLNDKQILSQAVDNMIDDIQLPTVADSEKGEDNGHPAKGVSAWIDSYVKDEIENAENWDIRKKIKNFSAIIFKEEYMRRDEVFRQRINDEKLLSEYRKQLFALKQAARNAIKEVAESLCETIDSCEENFAEIIPSGSWITEYQKNMREGNYANASITEKRLAQLPNPEDILKKAYKGDTTLIEKLRPVAQALITAEEQRADYIRLINTIDLSLQHISPLRLLSQIEEKVTEITNDSNRFILAKTPILLYSLIQGSDAPFVFEKMGTLFHNVMIDEFQDTSQLQWENFKVLLLENQASGGSDLIVGDIKQSIYRFRNGDWHILKNIENELKFAQLETKPLDTNYRSDVNVIKFNNAFFIEAAKLLGPENEKGIIEEIYEDVEQKYPDDKAEAGYVRVMLKTDKMDNWETCMLDDMCEQIDHLHKSGLPYHKMAVLVRDRTNIDKLIEHVHSKLNGVKMVSDEGFKLQSSTAVSMLIAALRVLCFGAQDIVSERYLIKQYMREQSSEEVSIETYATAKAEEVLPKEFTERIDELREYPLNELCEELYRILSIQHIKGEDAYMLFFFDELSNYLKNGISDIHSFLEYWESDLRTKSIPACQVDGINIITIHKSKGLQYHTVFMPFCDQPMEEVKTHEMLWCDTQKSPYNAMGSLPINGAKGKFEQSEYEDDYRAEQLQRRIDELNALYVAFTRAEHNLYVWGDGTRNILTYSSLLGYTLNNSMNSLCTKENRGETAIWQYGEVTIETHRKDEGKKKTKEKKEENRLSMPSQEEGIAFQSFDRKMDYRQSNEATRYIREQKEAQLAEQNGEPKAQSAPNFIEQGKLLHEIFSRIEHEQQLGKVLDEYRDRGIIEDEKQQQDIRKLIEKALQTPKARPWFDGSMKVMNECEIVHLDKETGMQVTHRPDRVMKSDEEVCVVDFKFGRPKPDEYTTQVQGYMNLLSAMYPESRVRGYLWYVYQNKIEEVEACF